MPRSGGAGGPIAPETPVDAIPGIVASARAAFDTGKTRPLKWRVQQLEAIIRLCEENKDAITRAIQADLGRAELECVVAESMAVVGEARHALANLPKWIKPRSVPTPLTMLPSSSERRPEPKGVILVISPWNFPINLCLMPIVNAVAAGNAVVIKPSEISAHSAALLGQLLPKYLDRECIRVIQGAIPQTSAVLEENFDHIIYTGGGSVGRIVMRAAAKHLTPVTLELGGKSPVIVDKSASLDVAARRILNAKYLNCGQVCVAPDYVLVHRDVADALLAKFKSLVKTWYGSDVKRSKDFGRIINQRHHDRICGLLEDHGGEVKLSGDHDRDDCFIHPTIIKNPDIDSRLMREEIFGPLLPVLVVNDVQEAISFVNARDKPLALYCFASNSAVIEKVLQRTSSGGVAVNDTLLHMVNPDLPFGGVGESGIGSYHGIEGFNLFSHIKSVLHSSVWVDPSVRYPPYNDTKTKVMSLAVTGLPTISSSTKAIVALCVLAGVGVMRSKL